MLQDWLHSSVLKRSEDFVHKNYKKDWQNLHEIIHSLSVLQLENITRTDYRFKFIDITY
jgi:hypothetical protein